MIVERICGADIERYLPAVAALRIAVFREWPYLYEGSLAYEQKYLAAYATSPQNVVVIARDGDDVVGAATGMPLTTHTEEVAPPLAAAGYDVERVFYFGESVLDTRYRGRGIGHAFLDEREAHARAHGFGVATFCAVERGEHPLRPAEYRSLDELWTKHGFVRRPDIVTTFAWRERGDDSETPKKMVFWVKQL